MALPYRCPDCGVEDFTPRGRTERACRYCAERERPRTREELRAELLAVFQRHGLNVAVGLTAHGVAIRSQDERVNAFNLSEVKALPKVQTP